MSIAPSLVMIPSGYKAQKVYSAVPTNGDGDFDFARSTSATRVNKNGLIEEVAVNVPRLDYSDGGCPSLLLEPASTNLLPYSTLAFNGGASPTGYSIGFGTGTFSHEELTYKGQGAVKQTQITLGRSYLDTGTLTLIANTEYNLKIQFDLNNCLADANDDIILFQGFSNSPLYQFSDIDSNGVLSVQFNTGVDNTGNIRIGLGCNGNEDGGKVLTWSMPQLEQGSYATSYIKTSGSPQTRSADSASGSGNSTVINSSEGVLYAEISALADDLTFRQISLRNTGDTSNSLLIGYRNNTNTIYSQLTSSGVSQSFISFDVSNITEINKVAVLYGINKVELWINGIKRNSSGLATNPIGLNELNFYGATSSAAFYGKIKDIRVYTTALTDAELTTLTTI